MRIVVAPDKFKSCLTAPAVAEAMARGARAACPGADVDLCPLADGGEGTVASLVAATGGRFLTRRVTGPLPEMKVDATFGMLGDGVTAVIEMAAASGLHLLKPQDRDPMSTTTFGAGELLLAAVEAGARKIILGIGGSATVDAGIGCAQACGLPVILRDGEPLSPTEPLCGRDLPSVVLIKHGRGSPIERVPIVVACDVINPLFGPTGAAPVYAPQKGATAAQVRELDAELAALAHRTGKLAEAGTPGAGAAGGLGFAMIAFFGASLRPGAEIVMGAAGLEARLRGAVLCLTGEGRLDATSFDGKLPVAVARLCQKEGVPCVAIVGSCAENLAERSSDLWAVEPLVADGVSVEQAIKEAERMIAQRVERVVRERLPV